MVCSHQETRISFHPLWLLWEIFSRPSCSFRTWTVSIISPLLRIKGSHKGNVIPRCGRKKAQSDLGLVWFKKMVTHHLVFITHHSSLITHHLKHPTLFGTITHLSSLNIFQLFVGPIHIPCAAFTLLFWVSLILCIALSCLTCFCLVIF